MKIDEKTLKKLLVTPGHVAAKQFKSALESAKKHNIPPEEFFVSEGLISDENFGKTVADYLNYHFVDLSQYQIAKTFLDIIPEVVAYAQQAIFFGEENNCLKLATSNTDNYEFIKLLEKKTGKKIEIYYATNASIQEALKYYKGDLREKVEEFIQCCVREGDEGDIVELVNLLLEYAHDSRASDIHIEPLTDKILIRFRIDGILHEAATYPMNLHEKVVFRIKIMSRLQTDEHAAAQDGRFEYEVDDTAFDVRVSIIPITRGENVVMRLLASHNKRFSLQNIGLDENDYEKIVEASHKPHGMVLAVGPTGSGKTTTLYTILRFLNRPEVNIMTIEDPVEYDMSRVQQTQVNQKKGLTFATGLRSIVRQDPDIIMVGEIRDEETADIAVNAAMTGHLLLSTLHTNDAPTTFPRLLEMGMESFLVASSVNVVISQRLVRKICTHCKKSHLLNKNERSALRMDPLIKERLKEISGVQNLSKMRLYAGAGCKVCGLTGFSGRVGIFEVLQVNEEIRSLVVEKASASAIYKKACELGMTPLLNDGLKKVVNGITTLEEVIKASKI